MPMGSPIGSGQGIPYFGRIQVIIEQASVPVVVDAGLGVPSDAAIAMELGADACLVNTAIAEAGNPALMGEAFAEGVRGGRKAFLAGRIDEEGVRQRLQPAGGRRSVTERRSVLPLPIVMLVTDRTACGDRRLEDVVEAAVEGGVNIVQLREKDLPAADLYGLALRLRQVVGSQALLLVNDRVDVALAAGAHGVELGGNGLPLRDRAEAGAGHADRPLGPRRRRTPARPSRTAPTCWWSARCSPRGPTRA